MTALDDLPDISLAELRRHDGDQRPEKWVAFQGRVYDVSDCPRWRTDLHERLHFPGQDLTSALDEAPHAADVFTRPCVRLVGRFAL